MTDQKKTIELDPDLKTAMGEAMGAVSVCWEHKEASGVFDSEAASLVYDALWARISARIAEVEAERDVLAVIVNSGVLDATRGGVRVPRFDVPYPGGSTTAQFMHTMADRIRTARLMGSNCSNTAADILDAYADAVAKLDGLGS